MPFQFNRCNIIPIFCLFPLLSFSQLQKAASGDNRSLPATGVIPGDFGVKVVYSSESNPGNPAWYKKPLNIPYKLSVQPTIRITKLQASTLPAIHVNPAVKYQQVAGFGTSLEESTIFNLARMSAEKRGQLLKRLVDTVTGAGMNVFRIAIGTSDFTGRKFYTYDDIAKGETDPELKKFSIQKDKDFNIVATLKEVLKYNPNIQFIASPWTAPGWMKTSDAIIGGSFSSENILVYARYLRMFLEAYRVEGIPVHAITLQNEPEFEPPDYPGMKMDWHQQTELAKALRAELDAHALKVKILVFDHNFSGAMRYPANILADPLAYAAVDGTAFHDYEGEPVQMTMLHERFPGKDIYMTERSVWGAGGAQRIIEYLRNWSVIYNNWVTMLDSNISPEQWTGVPGPTMMIQDAKNPDNYWMTAEYYLLAQFSKFIKPGAIRISSDAGSPKTVTNVAFQNPDGTLCMVMANNTAVTRSFRVLTGENQFVGKLPAGSVGTFTWKASSSKSPYAFK